jgi:arabinofuranosyltransferase
MIHTKKCIVHILVFTFILIFIILTSLALFAYYLPYEDDAYILLKYSRNIVNGCGFVWNCGEKPVEGFTSFLFQMILVITEKLGWTSPLRSGWLGIFFSTITLIIVWKLTRFLGDQQIITDLITIGGLVISPIFMKWTTSGLDTPLYSCLVVSLAFCYLLYKQGKCSPIIVGFIFFLIALARPEGIIMVALTLLFDFCLKLYRREKLSSFFVMVWFFLIFFLPYYAWRWHVFEYPFPNTYYAKTGAGFVQFIGGLTYVGKSMVNIFPIALIPVIIFLAVNGLFKSHSIDFDWFFICLQIVTSLGVVIINGGDHFAEARFIVPTLPLILILMSAGISRLMTRKTTSQLWHIACVVFIVLVTINWCAKSSKLVISIINNFQNRNISRILAADSSSLQYYVPWGYGFIKMGMTLHDIARSDQSIACVPIGAIGYYSEIRVIDMVGIVNSVIAHEPFDPKYTATWRPGHDKGDGTYILSQQPDYIQLIDRLTSIPLSEPDKSAMTYKSIVEIWNSPEFHNNYEFYPIQVESGWYYNLYRRIKTSPAVD